ncbi:High-affnity carbon uptake protein Hat/HatR [Microcystis aeruginosa NIES-2549]|uniref:High-affnity carbon uptake protein Hat/HatR n=1 Tax=Microcystis aeruginosa NIES-2549 TaxID=1641812 RepID=A0A0F6RLB6_MICAE|nr:WD40 repeat domain-containing protein [Microcystis aeruginosa]AKE64550.1 High-affnity carbon uptake protein Hat/HatR [Microcystis aeruginosa NIES-2549]AOC52947.1 High-affnity carbon uptake protein Hat/HatR [Microcystis aeruginosa NIES-2481]
MPNLNTSPTVKKRILLFLERLLTHVNKESPDHEYWSKYLSVRWLEEGVSHPKLIINTTLKILTDFCQGITKQKLGAAITVEQMRNDLKVLQEWEILIDNRVKTKGAANLHFTLNLWHSSTEENLKKFEEEWDKRKFPNLENSSVKTEINYDNFGLIPDISQIYGREKELELLKQKFFQNSPPCKIIGIFGIAGIGKTSLVCKLIEQIQEEFPRVIYWSFLNPPLPLEFLENTSNIISQNISFKAEDKFKIKLIKFIKILAKYRCLLFLDNIDAIIEHENYREYSEILQAIGQSKHNSCLIITSRKIPQELESLVGNKTSTYFRELQGLDYQTGRQILGDIDTFHGSEDEWQFLIQQVCHGNPLFIKSIAHHIQRVHHNNLSDFLLKGNLLIEKIESILNSYFQQLSDLEKAIIFELAINRNPVSLSELEHNIIIEPDGKSIQEGIRSLSSKILLDKKDDYFTIHPLLIEYFTQKIITIATEEIKTEKFQLLRSNSLTKTTVPDYLRKIQINVILHPIIKNLIHDFQENNLSSKLIDCLKTLKHQPSGQIGGIAGNIINLLNILKNGHLIGYDFSHIPIRQVDFSNIRLNQVDFSYSQFFDCIFPQTCGSILSISCSQFNRSFPREELLATGDSHGMIYLWKVKQDGKLELSKSFPAHGSWVWSVALNSEGQLLASGGQDGIVKIWSITTDISINCHSLPHPSQKHYAPIRAVTFSADSQFLATGSEDKTIKIWSVETGECLHTLEGHQERVGGVTFSPNGQLLASGSADKTIKIWSVDTGKCLHTLTGHQDWVWQVAFSSDGQLLASGSGDKTIKIWSIIEGEYQNIDTLTGHESWIWSIAFSPDGQYIASGSEDLTLRLWSVKTRECLQCFRGYGNRLSSITFSTDSQYILSGSIDRSIRLWSIKNHKCLQQINGHTDWICSVAFSPDGKTLISGSGDQTIRLWSGESGKVIKILQEKDYWVLLYQVAVSPNGQLIASTSHDNTIKLWDIRTDEKYTFSPEHQKRVWSIAFSPNSQMLVSGSGDNSVKLWSVPRGFCLKTFEEHQAWVLSVNFSLDGKLIATGSEDRTIKLWSIEDDMTQSLRTFKGHQGRIWSVVFSSDGQRLASSSDDQTVKVWQVKDGRLINSFEGHKSWVWSVAFSPDGKLLASGGDDATIRIWDVETGQLHQLLCEHTKSVRSVCFSPNGNTLASAGEDETIKLWNLKTGECQNTLRSPRLYEQTNIKGVEGLNYETSNTMKILGAFLSR